MTSDLIDGGDARPRRGVRLAVALWFATGVAAAVFYAATYHRAHPEAAIDLTFGRDDAVAQSKAFLEGQGFDLSDCRHAIAFVADGTTEKFLEKEIGLDEAARLMRHEVRAWYWFVRWFKPGQEEEYAVGFAPDGRLVLYHHLIPEADPGASLDESEARTVAEAFLDTDARLDRAGYTETGATEKKLPERMSRSFTWERKDFDIKGAKYRVRVNVDGGAVAFYWEELHVPESWVGEETRKGSQRRLLSAMGLVLSAALVLGLIAMLIVKTRQRDLRSLSGAGLGLLLGLVGLASWFNELPGAWLAYNTTDSVGAFYGGLVQEYLPRLFLTVTAMLSLAAIADAAGRDAFPRHVPLSRIWTRKFWRSGDVALAVFVGLCLALCHTAYYSAFYLAGTRAGVWCPIEPPPLNLFATPVPGWEPASIGLWAALTEEVFFRLFAISFLLRLTRRRWLAILLPAIAWALLHSNYPQEPVFIRALELTIVGVVYGSVFVRYGIVATLVSHYTYNALSTGTVLFLTSDPALKASGIVASGFAVLLLLPAALRVLRGKPLATAEEASYVPRRYDSGAEVVPVSRIERYAPFLPIARRPLRWLLSLAIAAAIGYLVIPRPESFGDFVRVTFNRWRAETIADAYLASRGIDVSKYRREISCGNDVDESADYLWQQGGVEMLNRVFRERRLGTRQTEVRYFVPYQIEQYAVSLNPDGSVAYYWHELEEEKPGAQLSQDDAKAIAERYLRDEKGIDLDGYRLVDASTHAYASRTDHWFTWEDTEETLGEATVRIRIKVQGDEPMGYLPFVKVPDEWSRLRGEQRIKDIVETIVAGMIGVVLMIAIGVVFHALLRNRLMVVRVALAFAAVSALLEVLLGIDDLATFWGSYDPSSSPIAYVAAWILKKFVLIPGGVFVATAFVVMLADGLYRMAFPHRHPLGCWFGLERFYRDDPHAPVNPTTLPYRAVWGQALIVGIGIAVLGMGLSALGRVQSEQDTYLETTPTIYDSAPDLDALGGYDSYVPAAATLFDGLQYGMLGCMGLVILASVYRRFIRKPYLVMIPVIVIAAFGAVHESETWREGFETFAAAAIGLPISIALVVAFARWIGRENVPAYAVACFAGPVLDEAANMVRTPEPYARWNGIALLTLLVLMALAGVILYRRGLRECPAAIAPESVEDNAATVEPVPITEPNATVSETSQCRVTEDEEEEKISKTVDATAIDDED